MAVKVSTRKKNQTGGEVTAIDGPIWRYLRKPLMLTDQQIFQFRAAVCPATINDKSATLIRIFNPDNAKEKNIDIKDYGELSTHPELILYEGYHVKGVGGELLLEKRNEAETSVLEKSIREGIITDIGVVFEKTTQQKWLGRLGKFLMYGGWLLVIVIALGIYILISTLTK